MFIRTYKTRNQVDIIIDHSVNAEYVAMTAMEWVEIPDQVVNNGDYFLDGVVIPPNSDEYDQLISPIITQNEENYKEQNGIVPPVFVEPEAAPEVAPDVIVDVSPLIAPPPGPVSFDNLPNDLHQLGLHTIANNNLKILINKLSSSENYTEDGNTITFKDPVVFLDGHSQTLFKNAHPSVTDWKNYLINNSQLYQTKIDELKTLLNVE